MRLHSWTMDGVGELPRIESGDLPDSLVVVHSHNPARLRVALAVFRRLLFASNESVPAGARASARLSGPRGEFQLTSNDIDEATSILGGDDTLRRRMRHIFDPHDAGGDGELDQRLAELREIEAKLREALEREGDYDARLADERRITAEVGQICADLADLRRRRDRLRAYAAIWPAWLRRSQPEKELATLEAVEQFPDTDIDLVGAQRAALESGERLRHLQAALRQARAELEVIPSEGDRHHHLDRVEALFSDLPIYRQQMTAFTRARARRDDLAAQRRDLRHASVEDGETVFDPSTLDLLAAREWLSRAEALAERESETRAELDQVRASLKQLRSERHRAVRAARTIDVELDDSDEHWRALWSLRDDLEELWEVQSQGESAARRAEEHVEKLQRIESRGPGSPGIRLSRTLWTATAVSFLAALYAARREDPTLAMILAGLAIGAALTDFSLGLQRRRVLDRGAAAEARAARLRHEIERARSQRDARWRSADEISRRVEAAAAALGLSAMPSFEEVEAAEMKLFAASRKLQERGPLAETALAVHGMQEREEELMAALREIRHTREAADLEWEEWKLAVGLPAGLRQENLTTYLCECDRWREIHEEIEVLEAQLAALAPAIEDVEASARELLRDVGIEAGEQLCGRELEDQILNLRDSARRSRQLLQRRTELSARIAEFEAQLAAVEPVEAEARNVFENLRKAAGTDDAVEFERRRQIFRRRTEIGETLRQRDEEFTREILAHRLTDDAETRAELTAGSADVWLEQAHLADTEIERLEGRMAAASHERAVAAAECRRMEESREVPSLRQERAGVREEIRRLVHEWRCLALASALLEAATESSRDQPIQSAARDNVPSSGNGAAAIGDGVAGGERDGLQNSLNGRHSEHLDGTFEPSSRWSTVLDIKEAGDPVPLVMEDALAGLDYEQAAAKAAEIVRLAATQQVFFFTADERSIDHLRRAGEEPRVISL